MPSQKRCTLTHIHDVLAKRKKVLILSNVCAKTVPEYPEFAVKECYEMITTSCPDVLDYLPNLTGKEKRLPERWFFWRIVYTLHHDKVEEYIAQVDTKRKQMPNLQDKKFDMVISDEYIDEFLKYDYKSSKKGRGFSSILINKKKQNAEESKDQIPQASQNTHAGQQIDSSTNGILVAPPGVQNVKLWYDKLNPAQKQAYQRGIEIERQSQLSHYSRQNTLNEQALELMSQKVEEEEFSDCEVVS